MTLEQKKQQVYEQYGFKISGNYDEKMLDITLGTLEEFPSGIIKQLTNYYKVKGKSSTIHFQVSSGWTISGIEPDGYFTFTNAGAKITIKQVDDYTIIHEIGHYINYMINEKYGSQRFKKEWISFNKGMGYIRDYNQISNKEGWYDIFAREYGAGSIEEDFATVMEKKLSSDTSYYIYTHPNTGLTLKLKYMDNILGQVFGPITFQNKGSRWYSSNPQQPSKWANSIVDKAKTYQILDETDLMFQTVINRGEFSAYLVKLIEHIIETNFKFYAIEKGVDMDKAIGIGDSSGNLVPNPQLTFLDCMNLKGKYVDIQEINALGELGIINGVGERQFGPQEQVNKEQAMVMIYKVLHYLGKIEAVEKSEVIFSDQDQISQWAIQPINYLAQIGIVGGDENKNFNPKKMLTYEEVYSLWVRLYELF